MWLIAAPCTAQLRAVLGLANSTHSWGTPYWTEDVADPAAEAGVVDQLNYVWWLELHSQAVTLQPGTYMAQVRLAKTVSSAGQFDLNINAESNGVVLGSTVLPVASQPIDTYVWSSEVLFTVQQPTVVNIAVRNTNGGQYKQNYRFDTARIGRVPVGRVVKHDSLDTWGFANSSFFNFYQTELGGVYGRVTEGSTSVGLTWLDLRKVFAMQAGTWVANVRLRNRVGPATLQGACDLTFEAFETLSGAPLGTVVIPAAAQQADQWVVSANLTITLAAPVDVTFAVYNHNAPYPAGYQFDSFSVRSTTSAFTTYGQGCGGLTLSELYPAQVGGLVGYQLNNAASAQFGLFVFGQPSASVPLDSLGAIGCGQHLAPVTVVGAIVSSGTATVAFNLPSWPELLGYPLDVQGVVLDSTAPGGFFTSNASQSYVGL
jgi:hypothetical protein